MIALQITSMKNFMNHLLVADTFDPFLLEEAKKSSVKCEKYHWFLCSLFFTISILFFCAYSTTF